MFDNLFESRRKRDTKRGAGVGLVSLLLHGGLIGAGIYATLGASETDSSMVVDTTLVYLNQPQQQEQEPPKVVQLDVELKGFQTVFAPTDIPTDIPAINFEEKFDPRDYSGAGVEGGTGTGIVPSGDHIYAAAVVEEKPEALVLERPPYPPLLKSAGIEGRVLVQLVVDTAGRPEPGSIEIVKSAHPGFNQAVLSMFANARFRPARVHGRPVRVHVELPIDFKITN